jgi:hypothetical protein
VHSPVDIRTGPRQRAACILHGMRRVVQMFVWLASVCGCANLSGLTGGSDADVTTIPESGVDATAILDSAAFGRDSSHVADSEAGGTEGGEATADASLDARALDAGPCSVVYVSADGGSDLNSGCSTVAPKQTVAAAVGAASALDAGTVEVCTGTYDENNLTLGSTISLRGGYDCTTWTSTAGVPDGGPGSTILQNTSANPATATLTIVASAGAVDGFTIYGPTAPAPPPDGGTVNYYAALEVTTTASAPTISDNFLVGGAGLQSSAGIVVGAGASPVIIGNTINGGSGAPQGLAANASTGILVEGGSGSVSVIGNTVHGGSGMAPNANTGFGSSALWFTSSSLTSGSFAVTGNTLYGGQGTVSPCTNPACFAVHPVLIVGPANVVFQGNVVQPTEPRLLVTSGANCPYTVELQVGGSLLVADNRIYGGECALTTSAPNASQLALAVLAYTGGNMPAIVENNMVHAGDVDVYRAGAGIYLNTPSAVIRANTVVGPSGPSSVAAIWLGPGATNNVVEGNIMAGSGGSTSVALQLDCVGPAQAVPVSVHDNLVFGAPGGLLHYNGAECTSSFFTVDDMNAALVAAGGGASGNVTVAAPPCAKTADGGSDLGCVPACAGGDAGCFGTLFLGWDNASFGVNNLFSSPAFDGGCPALPPPSGDGWPLVTTGGVPCQIQRSPPFDASLPPSDGGEAGAPVDAGTLTQDIYGNCRGPLPSMGAAEAPQDAACSL